MRKSLEKQFDSKGQKFLTIAFYSGDVTPREFWENYFGFRFGPYRPFGIRYHRTDKSHVMRLRINPEVKKEEIKARLIKPGVLEIEWPRKIKGEETPIE